MIKDINVDSGTSSPALHKTQYCLSGRLTAKKLVQWCNEQFKKFEVNNYEVIEISRTHFNQDDYEGGACRLIVKYRNINMEVGSICSIGYFMCFYKISEYEYYLKNGFELYLKNNSHFGLLNHLEIDVRKL